MTKYQHQKDINGCGIACLANLLEEDYGAIKEDFETKFYPIKEGIKIFDMIRYLKIKNLNYASKFFNKKGFDPAEANKFSKIKDSITLITKSEKYPMGYYFLRTKEGWVDTWYNFPSIDNVHAGVRNKLPENPWYVLYPEHGKIM
jgi:hypothetical protein